jgi:type I restriction enzyme R subunit
LCSAGEQHLRDFQDNDKMIPTVLTTSQKLSTGVDARNIRHIVLMRPIRSMIEFKQIIGRGTRTYEGKDFFTIWDFVKAHENFNDPEACTSRCRQVSSARSRLRSPGREQAHPGRSARL